MKLAKSQRVMTSDSAHFFLLAEFGFEIANNSKFLHAKAFTAGKQLLHGTGSPRALRSLPLGKLQPTI